MATRKTTPRSTTASRSKVKRVASPRSSLSEEAQASESMAGEARTTSKSKALKPTPPPAPAAPQSADTTPKARLPIRRLFGLRLFPDSLVLAALFALSLLLLFTSTRTKPEPAQAPAATTNQEETKAKEAPLPTTGDFQTAITLTTPAPNAIFRSGDLISGTAKAYGGNVYYRVVESTGRILTTGVVQTKDAATQSAFEARPTRFTANAAAGRIEVYGFSSKEGEAGKKSVAVRLR